MLQFISEIFAKPTINKEKKCHKNKLLSVDGLRRRSLSKNKESIEEVLGNNCIIVVKACPNCDNVNNVITIRSAKENGEPDIRENHVLLNLKPTKKVESSIYCLDDYTSSTNVEETGNIDLYEFATERESSVDTITENEDEVKRKKSRNILKEKISRNIREQRVKSENNLHKAKPKGIYNPRSSSIKDQYISGLQLEDEEYSDIKKALDEIRQMKEQHKLFTSCLKNKSDSKVEIGDCGDKEKSEKQRISLGYDEILQKISTSKLQDADIPRAFNVNTKLVFDNNFRLRSKMYLTTSESELYALDFI